MYGSPYLASRQKIWDEVSSALGTDNDINVVCRDFNQVEFSDKKKEGSAIIQGKESFSNWRLDLGLTELPFVGPEFTWCNNIKRGRTNI